MNSANILAIFYFSLTLCLINNVKSDTEVIDSDKSNNSSRDSIEETHETSTKFEEFHYVATTPQILQAKNNLSR